MSPTRNPLVRLLHIRDEIDGVAATIEGMSFEQFDQSYSAVRTVERALQIISEAAKSLPDDLLINYQSVDWTRIRALGNLLRHEYHFIDHRQIWSIATEKLPELGPTVDAMIAANRPPN